MPYIKPNNQKKKTCHLFINNVGPFWGVTAEDIRKLLLPFCSDASQLQISTRYENASYWHVTFPGPQGVEEATAALQALTNQPNGAVGGRVVRCKYAKWVPDTGEDPESQLQEHEPVACTTAEAGVPGLHILPEFITEQEEQALVARIDQQPWLQLSKRRVQHYGYKFEYTQRGVDLKQQVGAMPDWTQQVLQRVQELPGVPAIDQLTINEYTPGVGIAPHVDAHSSFTGGIFSLSLLGSCVMVFRKAYVASGGRTDCLHASPTDQEQQQHAQQDRQVCVFLPPRSLLVLSGEARYAWQHYIPHRKSDWVKGQQVPRADRRVSLTFRKVRGYPCHCSYPEYCDSQLGVLPPTGSALLQQQLQAQESGQKQATAPDAQQPPQNHQAAQQQQPPQNHQAAQQQPPPPQQQDTGAADDGSSDAGTHVVGAPADAAAALEGAHVHQVYDLIASHFSSTRFAVWPKVRAFLQTLPAGSVVADVGCGNGKYLGVRPDLAVLGSDRSAGLAAVAALRLATGRTASSTGRGLAAAAGADVFVCDAMSLAYRPCSCDAVLCIAVLHHISSRQRRLVLLQQLASVLRLGGKGLVTVWATLQEDPAKTIQRWHRISPAGAAQQAQAQGLSEQHEHEQQQLLSACLQSGDDAADAAAAAALQHTSAGEMPQQLEAGAKEPHIVEGPDYFVPWHLPFHKAGALAATVQQPVADSKHRGPAGLQAPSPGPAVDEAKGAVVLQRYYHLFEEGELEGLVSHIPGLRVLQIYYDRSNWCVEFEKHASS